MRQFARKPAAASHLEAGALPLAGLTAWQILVDTARVEPGQRVLVTAAGGGPGIVAAAAERGVRAILLLVEPDGHGLEALAALVDAGQLRVEIDSVLPLAEAARAHEISQAGHARGKIVLEVAGT